MCCQNVLLCEMECSCVISMIGTYHTNMYISYLSIYAFVGIVFAVGALFMKRDIWYVKREIVLTVVNWSFFALVYAVVNLFSQVTTL